MKKLLSLLGMLTLSTPVTATVIETNDEIVNGSYDFNKINKLFFRSGLYIANSNINNSHLICTINDIKLAIINIINNFDVNFKHLQPDDFIITIKSTTNESLTLVQDDNYVSNTDLMAVINKQEQVNITIINKEQQSSPHFDFDTFIFIKQPQVTTLGKWLHQFNQATPALIFQDITNLTNSADFKPILWNACFGNTRSFTEQQANFSVTITDGDYHQLAQLSPHVATAITLTIAVNKSFICQPSATIFAANDHFTDIIYFQLVN